MKRFLICVGLVATIISNTNARTIWIPDEYSTIQEGINASTDGDTVLVQPDIYFENIDFNGHNITLGSQFLITGDTSFISLTIIDGDSINTVVTFENGEDSTCMITGFTLNNGFNEYGGGIGCAFSSNPKIFNNIIKDNSADFGGGICCYQSDPEIKNNRISCNKASISGGAIWFNESNPVVESNVIDSNNAGNLGGALFCSEQSNPLIKLNYINDNVAESYGGGVFCTGSSNPIILENTIDGNSANQVDGGGVWCGQQSNPIIINNTITNNTANLYGGGICTLSSPSISENLIEANIARVHGGGGIYCGHYSSWAIIENNRIINNQALGNGRGGGIFCKSNSNITVMNNEISHNITYGSGGGIGCIQNASPLIINNVISANTSHIDGGGIWNQHSNAIISGNIVLGNSTSLDGGGIVCDECDPTITNNIIIENSALAYGGGMRCQSSNAVIKNNIIRNNTADQSNQISVVNGTPVITYNNVENGFPGEGNISSEPLFRDPENNDFHLMATYCGDPFDSPCIDMGDPLISDYWLDCFAGLGETRSDMGAYGGQGYITGISEDDEPILPTENSLYQNYPNPFNVTTTITFDLVNNGNVSLSVFNLIGQKIETLIKRRMESGQYDVNWNASGLSSGVYFYKLTTNNQTLTKRMTLLK